MKEKQKRFDARRITSRRIEMRARAALRARGGQKDIPDSRSKRQRLQEEMAVQAKLYRAEKSEAKQQRTLERQIKSAEAKARADARYQRDMAWGEIHADDTDAELIAYVQACAEQLGHTPYCKEILGGEYIRSRFAGWPMVLTLAGLPLPQDMKPPTKKMLAAYEEIKRKSNQS